MRGMERRCCWCVGVNRLKDVNRGDANGCLDLLSESTTEETDCENGGCRERRAARTRRCEKVSKELAPTTKQRIAKTEIKG